MIGLDEYQALLAVVEAVIEFNTGFTVEEEIYPQDELLDLQERLQEELANM